MKTSDLNAEDQQLLALARPTLESYTGKLAIKFLKDNKNGVTMNEIINYLQRNHGTDSEKIYETVEFLLENATAMGFIESPLFPKSANWIPREENCRSRDMDRKRRPRDHRHDRKIHKRKSRRH